jgi:hypothetical protein
MSYLEQIEADGGQVVADALGGYLAEEAEEEG